MRTYGVPTALFFSACLAVSLALGGCASNTDELDGMTEVESVEEAPVDTEKVKEVEELADADDPDREIEVQVVSQSIENQSDGYTTTTTYEYDEAGRVVSTTQSTDYPESMLNKCIQTLSYDEDGRLVMISNAYEQYGWNVASEETFTYDEAGRCATYAGMIVSEGEGGSKWFYSYDGDSDRIVSADQQVFGYGPEPTDEYGYTWSYLDDGMLGSVSSDGEFAGTFTYLPDQSDAEAGVYAYTTKWGTIYTFTYDDAGNLIKIEENNDGAVSTTEYTYETITVKYSDFTPSVYSNPTGFDLCYQPQLDAQDVARIKGE